MSEGISILHRDLALLAIAEIASIDLVTAMALRQAGYLELMKQHCRASVYWPTFCALVRAGDVREDFTGNLCLGRCVIGWARGELERSEWQECHEGEVVR